MDQIFLVNGQIDSGSKLIDRLAADGFGVELAFWLKESESGQSYLYLATPELDQRGIASAYMAVQTVVGRMPELGMDPLDVKLVGVGGSVAVAARKVVTPKAGAGEFAVRNPKPYPGITRFGGSSLGGLGIEGAVIYPPIKAVGV